MKRETGGLTLGIETSTARGGVALRAGGRPVAEGVVDTFYEHSSRLIRVLDETLTAAGRRVEEISAVGVGVGPGSFTGLRVGLATGRGIAYALEIPIYGVSSLRVLAEACSAAVSDIAALARARKGWYYRALYRREGKELEETAPPELVRTEELAAVPPAAWIVSPDFELIRKELGKLGRLSLRGETLFPSAAAAARQAEERAGRSLPSEADKIEPVYLGDYTRQPQRDSRS